MSITLFIVLAALGAAATSAFGVWIASLSGPIQTPGSRSNHDQPIPAGGGLGVALGVGVAVAAAVSFPLGELEILANRDVAARLAGVIAAAAGLAALGAVDDVVALSAKLKFPLIAAASLAIAVFAGPAASLPASADAALHLSAWAAVAGSSLWVFTVINAVNFMDGANGLAGGAMAIASGALSVAAMVLGAPAAALASAALCGALVGYLPFNARARARVFLGDSGSLFVGGIFAGVGLLFISQAPAGGVYLAPLLIMPLLADVLLTLAARAKTNWRSVLAAHAEHAYQVRIAAGNGHLDAARIVWARCLIAAAAVMAWAFMPETGPGAALALMVGGALLSTLAWRGDRRWAAARIKRPD